MAMHSGKGAGGVGQGMQNHPGLGGLLTENPILPAAQLSLGVYRVLVEPGPPQSTPCSLWLQAKQPAAPGVPPEQPNLAACAALGTASREGPH